MNKLYEWLLVSNRLWHLLGVYIVSLALGWASGITAIACLEFKDVQHSQSLSSWDWLDCVAGLIGCVIGGGIHFAITKHW